MMTREYIGFQCSDELKKAVDVLSGGYRQRSAYLKNLIMREAQAAGIIPRLVIDLKPNRVTEAAGDEKS